MFYDRLTERCAELGLKLTPLVTELGYSSGAIGRWKAGTLPNGDILVKLARRLECSVDYLLGLTDQKKWPTPENGDGLSKVASAIMAYVSQMPADEQEAFLVWLQSSQGRG